MFFSFEGVEGSGKSTLIKRLEAYLIDKGYDVVCTREPGGTSISEQIREILLDNKNTEMDPTTEAYLYAASRNQHVREVIIPALKLGKIVLCDRFVDSSLAYQGYSRGLGIEKIYEINKFAMEEIFDKHRSITFFINTTPRVGLDRIFNNNRAKQDRLDLESMEFHSKVYKGFLEVAKMYRNRIITVKDGEINDVYARILELVELELSKDLK